MELHDKHSFALSASAANVKVVNNLSNLSTIAWSEDSWILGEGSNTVFTDDFKGQLILNRLRGHHITESASHYMVTLAAGENWHNWVCELVERGMLGFENLALIPGSVGAAPVQNIGAYGVEVSQFIKAVEGVDLATQQPFYFTADDCTFAYRDSIFKRPDRRSLCITQGHT
jgi:UDP-N-acetylmuramate dehydrogenase